jgi:hypothetical protein
MMTSMTRAIRTLGIPATVLVLAACGSSEVGGGTGPASSTPVSSESTQSGPATGLPRPTAPATSPTYGQGPHGPDASRVPFPMTVSRTGGIAGFRDRVVLQADGTATVTRRASSPQRCRVDIDLMEQIRASVDGVDWPVPGSSRATPPGKIADQMFVTVTSGRHSASLDDPGLGKLAAPLSRLLGDITQPPAERTLCQPL